MPQRLFLLVCGAVALLSMACLDALYEDVDPPVTAGGWVVCCQFQRVSTCPCNSPQGCTANLLPCPGGECRPPDAGFCGGGGGLDGGSSGGDAGLPQDAGADAGSDAGTPVIRYVVCCVPSSIRDAGVVTTCACSGSACDDAGTFTACSRNTCVQSGACP